MKTDKWWLSALWGRLGAAIVLLATAALHGQEIDITQDQMDAAVQVVGNLIDNFYLLIGAGLAIWSKLREAGRVKAQATDGQADNVQEGRITMSMMVIMLAGAMFGAAFIFAGMSGCSLNQTATGQIAEQTADPGTIALAVFADAQDAYIEAAELYLPYQATMQKNNPALDREIREIFRKADKILTDWELYGDVPAGDKEAFRAYLREISIMAAEALDGKL